MGNSRFGKDAIGNITDGVPPPGVVAYCEGDVLVVEIEGGADRRRAEVDLGTNAVQWDLYDQLNAPGDGDED